LQKSSSKEYAETGYVHKESDENGEEVESKQNMPIFIDFYLRENLFKKNEQLRAPKSAPIGPRPLRSP
jgi:hypothetical protein